MDIRSTGGPPVDEAGGGVRPFFQTSMIGFDQQDSVVLLVEYREPDGAWVDLPGSVQPNISEIGFFKRFLPFMPVGVGAQVEFRATVADSATFAAIDGARLPTRRVLGQDPVLMSIRGGSAPVGDMTPQVSGGGGGLDMNALAGLIQQMMQATVAPIVAQLEASKAETSELRARLLDEKRDERLASTSLEEAKLTHSAGIQNSIVTTLLSAQTAAEAARTAAETRRREEEEEIRRKLRQEEEDRRRERAQEAADLRRQEAEDRRQARLDAEAAHKLQLETMRETSRLEILAIQARADKDKERSDNALLVEQARLDKIAQQEADRQARLLAEEKARLDARRQEDKDFLLREQALQEQHFALQLKMLESLNPKGQSDVERMMEGVTTVVPNLLSQFGLETADLKDFAKDMVKRVLGGGGGDGEEGGGGSPILESVIEHIGPVAIQAFERYMNRTAPAAPTPPPQIPVQVPVPRPPMWTPNPVPAPPIPFEPPMLPNNLPPQPVTPAEQPVMAPVQTSVPGLDVAQVSSARQVAAQIGAAVQMSPRDQWSAKIGALLTGEFNAYIQEMGANDALITYGEIPPGYYPTVKQEVEALIGASLKD